MTSSLTPALRGVLKAMAESGGRTFDMRRTSYDDATYRACDTLARMRYLSASETGPGGSILSFRLTDAGRAALKD